jgi:F-type H+-transporting ATPase subunit delta
MISRPELAEVIAKRTLHVSDVHHLEQAIAGYLLEQDRTDDIESLMRDVLKYRASLGYIEATVVSAYPLTSELVKSIEAILKSEYPGAKSYVLNQRIDESVVGGVRLEMAGEELDLTVRAKLNTLKRLTATRNK